VSYRINVPQEHDNLSLDSRAVYQTLCSTEQIENLSGFRDASSPIAEGTLCCLI